MRRHTGVVPRSLAGVLPVACVLVAVSPAPATAAAPAVPHVVLSPNAPGVVHHPDGSWTVPIGAAGPGQPRLPGGCQGTYINPSIVARGNGTAVHFGVKYICTEPVEYTVQAGVEDWYDEAPGGPVLGHLGADPQTRTGVSMQPFVDGYSYPCKNNANSGWQPYDFSTIHGEQHNGDGYRTTVGCRV